MANPARAGIVDLSHVIEHGMTTYPGLPGPHICDFWSREASAANYDDGSTFQIGRIDMVANTGTYLDSPFHRYSEGKDLSELSLGSLADLPGIVVRRPYENGRAAEAEHFDGLDVRGKAVLVHNGSDRHWRTGAYGKDHPFLAVSAGGERSHGSACTWPHDLTSAMGRKRTLALNGSLPRSAASRCEEAGAALASA